MSKTTSRKGLVVGVLVAVAALLAGWLSQYAVDGGGDHPDHAAASHSSDPSGSESGSASGSEGGADNGGSPELMKLARRDAGDPMAVGRKDAPVVLIEYADFGCPFCGKFARDTQPQLEKKYVRKGVLRIEWRNFPVFGEDSERAALAAWAAGRQGRFWQFHEAAYAAAEGGEKKDFTDAQLRAFAERAGVPDMDRFDRDRTGDAAREALTRDQQEGYRLGVSATPAFLVNGRPIAGAQPQHVFTDVVERAARQAQERSGGGR